MRQRSNPSLDIPAASASLVKDQSTTDLEAICMTFNARTCWPLLPSQATTSVRLRDGWACHAIRFIGPFVTSRPNVLAHDGGVVETVVCLLPASRMTLRDDVAAFNGRIFRV